MRPELKNRFRKLWLDSGVRTENRMDYVARESLEMLYSAPERHYHTLEHIEECLGDFDSAKHLAKDPLALEFAIWYHDVIYDPKAKDNEERSAWFLGSTLKAAGLYPEFIDRTNRLILATKHDYLPRKQDEKLITDIDLAILGKPDDIYGDYCFNIWKEYSWAGPEKFGAARADVLEGFLQRNGGHIYSTDFFREKYEEMAVSNITRNLNFAKGLDEDL